MIPGRDPTACSVSGAQVHVAGGAFLRNREWRVDLYNGAIPEAVQARRAAVGLTVFNDVILRVAIERRLPVLDLRLICNEPADYANPIEPSGRGGEKIARAIARVVGAWPEAPSPSVVRGAT
jgi:hypothetical protein